MDIQNKALAMLGAVIMLQVVDAGLHIAINEVEMLRILSNAVLVIGASLGVFLARTSTAVIWAGAVGYLILNLVFVTLFGLENPVTGVNRTPLFAFMALSLWLTFRMERLHARAGEASSA